MPAEGRLVLTELFARIAPSLDVDRDRAAGVQAVAHATGHAPVSDPRLQAAAQAAAEHYFAADAPAEPAMCVEANAAMHDVPMVSGTCITWRLPAIDSLAEMDVFRQHYDHFGIGLSQGHRTDGPPGELFVVVLAAQLRADTVDTHAFERQVLDAANAARAGRSAPPLRSDDALRDASRALAARWLNGVDPTQLYADAATQRGPLGLTHAATQYQSGSMSSPAEAAQWGALMAPAARRVGIGVVQGDRAGQVGNTIAVFVYAVSE